MRKGYLITFDLKKTGKDYSGLYKACQTFAWWHYMDSCYIVVTDKSPNEIHNIVVKHIDENDFLLIIEVKPNYQGWLPPKAYDWMMSNIPT